MEFSYYPMNLDLLYLLPLYFGNDIIPKFIHFVFALLTARFIFIYLKSRINKIYGLLGTILFLSIPVIVKLSTTVYVDLGEIFFSFASLILVLEWVKNKFKLKYLLYSGIMCGLALGTKYNGLVTLLILALFIPFIYSRANRKKRNLLIKSFGNCIIFVFISLLLFSPWMIRNYQWKGNPIYPLYNSIFDSQNEPVHRQEEGNPEKNEIRQNHGFFTYRSVIFGESGVEIALLPLRIFFQGKDGDPQYFDGKLNPVLLIFPFFAFFRLRDDPEHIRREKKMMLAFAVLFFSVAFFTAVLRVRYISPIIPPLVILSMFGIRNLFSFISASKSHVFVRSGKSFIMICLVFFLSLNGIYIFRLYKTVDPIPYTTGEKSRDEYISGFIPEYPVLKYINTNLPEDSRVYFVLLGKRGYYCERDYLFNMGIMNDLIKRAGNPEDIRRGFHNMGITHLLVNYALFERWMADNFSEEKQTLTKDFFQKHLEPNFFYNGFGVTAL
jgi:4-amino-4-deoxy-L-arabinose transferase-like glycosyltransferase